MCSYHTPETSTKHSHSKFDTSFTDWVEVYWEADTEIFAVNEKTPIRKKTSLLLNLLRAVYFLYSTAPTHLKVF